ncbi:unnamed protein product [Oikopleura dioica]|uniref:Connexin cysteine-rich domain-containing protein n=1 Tax=Oikopleura dioica TaxID=34765 RepID=E4Z602_OIKDI|nr:unnamed protein product [Oikopleura dioica]
MPGCENVCHNLFLPIVLDRFWNIEFIFICSPTIFFVAYAAYTNTRLDAAIANDKRPDGIDDNDYIKHLDTRLGMKRKKTYFDGKDYRQGTYFWTVEEKICYMFHLIIRKARRKVQQNKKSDFWDVWEVPERFVCEHGKTVSEPRLSPCWTDETVTCWIARPREKTLAVKYMFGIQILSIILTVTELIFETTKWASKKITRAKPMNDYG